MIKIVLTIGILIGFNSTIFSQSIELQKADLEKMLCNRWGIDFAKMGSMIIGQMPGAKDFDFLFKKDGTYEIIDENGTKFGNWIYYTDKKYIELSIDDKITSRIKTLTNVKLILTMVNESNDPPGLPEVEVHFKPI